LKAKALGQQAQQLEASSLSLRGKPPARQLWNQAKALFKEATKLILQAQQLEAQDLAKNLRVGMTVYIRSIPVEWTLQGILTHETKLRIERLTPKHVLVSRADGEDFLFTHGRYKQIMIDRTNFQLAPASSTLGVETPQDNDDLEA
jgi:hypothetical protein